MDAGGFLGGPFAAGAAPAGGLLFGQNNCAVRFALFAEAHGYGVGGVNFEEVVDASRKRRAMQAAAEQFGIRTSGIRSMW